MTKDLLMVFSNPTDSGRDDEFNAWYDEQHIGEVLEVPGVVAAQRYTLAPMEPPSSEDAPALPPPTHRYLATYELDREPNEVMGEFLNRITSGAMVLPEFLDLAGVAMAVWSPQGPRRTE